MLMRSSLQFLTMSLFRAYRSLQLTEQMTYYDNPK